MFTCDKCGTVLVIDYKHSAISYDSNVTTVLDEGGNINFDNLPDEVSYVCRRCGSVKKIALNSVVELIKGKIIKAVLDVRYSAVYTTFDSSKVDEASGVSFCGMCYGMVDDSGYCYNDVIKECPVRKILNDKKHLTKCREYKK